jgi:dTDP-4-dehydrorhamnose 3,5-epimerase
MGNVDFNHIIITPLARINVPGGDVMHAMRSFDRGFNGFGEAYFSWIEPRTIKAWKLHSRMIMNLIVPIGCVRFVFCENNCGPFQEIEIGPKANYSRITVPPNIWFGFQGRDKSTSLILNLANIVHEPAEARRADVNEFQFDWVDK